MSDVHAVSAPDAPSVHAMPAGNAPRSSRRRWVIVSAILVVSAAVCWGVYRQLRTSELAEPFDVEAYVAYTLPDEQNAFTYYRRAVAKLVSEDAVIAATPAFKRDEFWESWAAAPEKGWDHAVPSVRKWVKLNRPMLAELKQGADCAESLQFPLADAANASSLSLTWARLRACFHVQTLEGLRLTAERHPAEAWDCFRNSLRSSRHLAMHSDSIETMFGMAFAHQASRAAILWAADPSVGPADLRRAIQDLLEVEAMRAPASDTIKLEYLWTRSYAERPTLGGSPTRSWIRATGYPAQVSRCARLVVANLLTQADRPKYLRTAVHPGELHLFELDPAAPHDPRQRPPQEIEATAANSASTFAHVLQRVSPEAAQQLEFCDATSLLSSLWQASQWRDVAQADRSGLLLALALELYYREHHEVPATLQELVAGGILKSIPLDPLGAGEPYHYRRETPATRGATLWSVYTDGVDNGGASLHNGTGDLVMHVPIPGTRPPTAGK